MVQIRVTPKTRNPFTIKALSISGVTWKWHFLNHALRDVVAAIGVVLVRHQVPRKKKWKGSLPCLWLPLALRSAPTPIDVARRPRDEWIIDFTGLSQAEAAYFAAPYAHVVEHVKPLRDTNNDRQRRERWWLFGRSGSDLRKALSKVERYVVTPEVSKHRIFAWLSKPVLPDCQLMVVTREDDTTFGVLQSRFHELWALRLGSSLEDRPRYTPSTTFETFPFPPGLTPNCPAMSYANDPRAQAIAQAAKALVTARDRWLNPPELVISTPEIVPGFPERLIPRDVSAAVTLRSRTLTALYNQRGTPEGAWLDSLHRTLDEAVAAAYSWPANLPDDDLLTRLLALNFTSGSVL